LDIMVASECIHTPVLLLTILFMQILESPYHHALDPSAKQWVTPEFQQLMAKDILKNIIDKPVITLQNPNIVHTKEHPSRAFNNQQANSTKRNLSSFELVDNK
ncbi:2413_t:CDS:2, partial [Gigaspora rosea]